jgi:hypothetical protein
MTLQSHNLKLSFNPLSISSTMLEVRMETGEWMIVCMLADITFMTTTRGPTLSVRFIDYAFRDPGNQEAFDKIKTRLVELGVGVQNP